MADDDIIVQFKNGSKQRYAASAKETIERLRGKDIFHIHGINEPDKKQTSDATINVNVVAIRLIKKGMDRKDITEVLSIPVEMVPDVKMPPKFVSSGPAKPPKVVAPVVPPATGITPEQKEEVIRLKKVQKLSFNKIVNKTGIPLEQVKEICAAA